MPALRISPIVPASPTTGTVRLRIVIAVMRFNMTVTVEKICPVIIVSPEIDGKFIFTVVGISDISLFKIEESGI